MAKQILKLGEVLKQEKIIDEYQLNSALSYQRNWGGRLGSCLIKLGYLTEEALLEFLAKQLRLERVDLYKEEIPGEVLKCLSGGKARQYHVMPVRMKQVQGAPCLMLATCDPTNLQALDDLQFIAGCRIQPVLAAESAIDAAIEVYYESEVATLVDEDVEPSAPKGNKPPASAPAPVKEKAKALSLEEKHQELLKVLLGKGVLTNRDYDRLK